MRDRFLRGILIGVFFGLFLAFAVQRAGFLTLPAMPAFGAAATTPTPTPYPRLNAISSVQVVTDRLPKRITDLIVAGRVRGIALPQGRWLVKWGDAEWEVDERTREVAPLTGDAKFFLGLSGP